MDVPTRPGDALAQPTRARLFEILAKLRRPASTEELAELLQLHPNGVRLHLERMRDAGLLLRQAERRGRGRPRNLWTVAPDAEPGGDPPTSYAELSRWLVRSLTMGGTRVRDVERAGRQIGRELAEGAAATEAEQRLHDILVTLGFQPERRRDADDRLTYCLRNCPYRDAVRERQSLVCGLHRGMTRGLLDVIDPRTKLVGFVPKDPDAAGCLIETRGPIAGSPTARDEQR